MGIAIYHYWSGFCFAACSPFTVNGPTQWSIYKHSHKCSLKSASCTWWAAGCCHSRQEASIIVTRTFGSAIIVWGPM